jgi:hypothetical protein
MILNTTEFLFCSVDIRNLIKMRSDCYYPIPSYMPFSSKINIYPQSLGEILKDIETVGLPNTWREYRIMHSYKDGNYSTGRHSITLPKTSDIDAYVLWLGWHPWNEKLIKRKLQIKNKMMPDDIAAARGFQHMWGREQQELNRIHYAMDSVSPSDVPGLQSTLNAFIT